MKIKKILFIAILITSILPTVSIAEDVIIPILLGQTGASATFGKAELEGYTLAVEEWNKNGGLNGKKISLKIEDTQTSQKQIVTAFHRFALKDYPVIMGPTWLDAYQAIIPIARKKNILLVTPSAAKEAFSKENSKWPISFYHNTTKEMQVLAKWLSKHGYKRIAMIYEQEPFAEMASNLFANSLQNLVNKIGVQGGEADFLTILNKLKKLKPDILVIFVWNEKSLLTLLQQIRVYLPQLPLATMHDAEGWLNNKLLGPLLPHIIYSQFVISDKSFIERFQKKFGHPPMLTASNAYDALNSVLLAFSKNKSNAQDIKEYIMTQTLETATFGKFKFSLDGNIPSKVIVVEHKK